MNIFKSMLPFYIDGRRFLRLTPHQIDAMLATGTTAKIEDGTVTFTDPAGECFYAKVRILARRRAAAWVNKYDTKGSRLAAR